MTEDWLQEQFGPASKVEKALLAALLPTDLSSTSSSKWNDAGWVLARHLSEPTNSIGGAGIENAKEWTKHRHNRRQQKGFAKLPISVFVADDVDATSPVAEDYDTAIRDRQGVQTALLVVRRSGALAGIAPEQSAEHARVVAIVSAIDAPHLAEIRDIAPEAPLRDVDPRARKDEIEQTGPTLDFEGEELPQESRIVDDLSVGQCWVLLQSDSSIYADMEGASYHFRRTTRASGNDLQPGDWALGLRASDSKFPDRGRLFGLARIGRVHRRGDDRYAVFDRYWPAPEAPTFVDLGGDPRPTPQNPMTKVDRHLVVRWAELAGLRYVDQMIVPPLAVSLETVRRTTSALVLPAGTIEACLAALRSGKHLLLTGPPGTGKSTLAIALAVAAAEDGVATGPLVTTGTADWTSVETVGAYRLRRTDQQLTFHAGHFLDAVDRDAWLVVDELNRADIDKAVGQLFSVLSGQAVVLPYDDNDGRPLSVVPPGVKTPPGTTPYSMSPHWRLIATMNERDRDLLFTLSEAFIRRFAVIRVGVPSSEKAWVDALSRGNAVDNRIVRLAARAAVTPGLEIGPAVLRDCVRYATHRLALDYETGPKEAIADVTPAIALREAVTLLLEPQLAGHFEEDRGRLLGAIDRAITEPTHPTAAGEADVADTDAVDPG